MPPIVCSGLGDCEETSGGMTCGVGMGVGCVLVVLINRQLGAFNISCLQCCFREFGSTSNRPHNLSRPDLRDPFMSLFWFGQGVSWGGHSMLCVLSFLFLCVWPGVLLNQRQLSIVVSD